MDRSNQYEAAFEAYLRDFSVGCLPVDESKRSLIGDSEIKSLDFVVVGPNSMQLTIDVKGRKFPSGPSEKPVHTWQSWVMEEDPESVLRWAAHFGTNCRAVLAFVYRIVEPYRLPPFTLDLFAFRKQLYLMRGVAAVDYLRHMRPRSRRWRTVHVHAEDFRKIIRPMSHFLGDRRRTNSSNIAEQRAIPI